MRSRVRNAVALAASFLVLGTAPALAPLPFPATPADPYDYTRLHITNGSCQPPFAAGNRPAGSDLPNNFDCVNDWRLSDYAARPGDFDDDPLVAHNPQELFGVKGPGTNLAWEVTTGRPDTIIAVMDSGIRRDEDRRNLVNKYVLSRGELPVPGGTAKGGPLTAYDVNHDGVFNVKDYTNDPRAVGPGRGRERLSGPERPDPYVQRQRWTTTPTDTSTTSPGGTSSRATTTRTTTSTTATGPGSPRTPPARPS